MRINIPQIAKIYVEIKLQEIRLDKINIKWFLLSFINLSLCLTLNASYVAKNSRQIHREFFLNMQ